MKIDLIYMALGWRKKRLDIGVFVKFVGMFDISANQFIHSDSGNKESLCRKHIDVLLNTMNEKELVVMEATAEGLKKARETEVPEQEPPQTRLRTNMARRVSTALLLILA
jgi:hypothetical protein